MLAALVTPVLLYAGLAAAAIPLLIHLLNRRRFQRLRWSAMQFLLEAQRRNRRRVRMEEWILLALRCLAVFLIGAMLARWFSSSQSLWAMVGAGARTERIILLDDSYSMMRSGASSDTPLSPGPGNGGGEAHSNQNLGDGSSMRLFDQAVAAVEQLVRTLREQSPGDSLTLLLTSRPDSPIYSEATLSGLDVQGLSAELATRVPSYRSARMVTAMTSVRRLLESRAAHSSACLYVVSDFQRVDWQPQPASPPDAAPASAAPARGDKPWEQASPTARPTLPSAPASVLADWPNSNRSLKVVLIDVGSSAAGNLAVTAIEPRQPQPIAGIETAYSIRVANFGSDQSRAMNLQSYVGDAGQAPTPVPALAPGQTAEVRLEVTFPDARAESLAVELPSDVLAPDNNRWRAVNVARQLRVLLIDGEKSADPYHDEVFLLAVALRPEGVQFSGNEVTIVDEADLETVNLADFHVAILANVYRITETVTDRLTRYAADGGGLVFFMGDQVDSEVYNRLLYRDGEGPLPARLGALISTPADQPGLPIRVTGASHPLARPLSTGGPALLGDVRIWQYLQTEVPSDEVDPTTQPQGSPSDARSQPADLSQPGPVTLAVVDDAERSPLLLTRPYGRGQVMLFTTSADKEWNNLCDQPAYVVWMLELVQTIARRHEQPREFLIGEPIHWNMDLGRFKPVASLRPPGYPAEPAVDLQAQPDARSGQVRLHWPNTDHPGIYRLEMTDINGQTVSETLAVNVDPTESDLTAMDRAGLLNAWGQVSAEYKSAGELTGLRDERHRREMWPVLFVVLLCTLVAEQSLAWYFGAGRRWQLLWRKSSSPAAGQR